MRDENSKEEFDAWMADTNTWGDLENDYADYLQGCLDAFFDLDEGLQGVMTYETFAREKYEKFLLEIHKDDELDELDDDTEEGIN